MIQKSNLALLFLTSLSSITLARAEVPLCGSLLECLSLRAQVEDRVAELSQIPTLDTVARKADGSVFLMTQFDAISYCATRGGLPTARQLALAMNPGAVSPVPRKGFHKIEPKDEPAFFYNFGTGETIPHSADTSWYWSSSIHATGDLYAYVFVHKSNDVVGYNRNGDRGFVRCVKNP